MVSYVVNDVVEQPQHYETVVVGKVGWEGKQVLFNHRHAANDPLTGLCERNWSKGRIATMATALETAIETWRVIDLNELQRTLDLEAESIGARKEAADLSRKELLQATRAFRGEVDDTVRKAVAPLMKRFQKETDTLTKRAKAGESVFFSIYKKLADAPDPTSLLEGVLSEQSQSVQNQELVVENEKLQKTIQEYHEEFAEIKNQEVTVKRLQDKLDEYEKNMESTIQSRLAEKERHLQREFAEKERELNESQLDIATKLGNAEQTAATAHDALDATQSELFDLKAKYDEDMAARTSEIEMLEADIERLNIHVATTQRELETERSRMADQQKESVGGVVENEIDAMTVANLEREVLSKDEEINQMIDTNRELQRDLVQLKQNYDNRIAGFENALQSRNEENKELKKLADERTDYDAIKDELSILKSVEFGNLGPSEEDRLETMLMRKNRLLEAENTDVKIRLSEIQAKLDELESVEGQSSSRVQEQEALITQLEGDLTTMKVVSSGDTASTTTASAAAGGMSDISMSNEAPDGNDSLLNIVSSQRDRFRTRNMELEAEARHQKQAMATLRSEVDTLRSDNVKLYEKIKFVQSYQSSNTSSEDTVKRYSSQYEEAINPFAQFNAKEKQRKYTSMSPADKMVHTISKFVLSNRQTRLFFVGYIMIIHALVFFTLMRFSHSVGCSQVDLAEQCLLRYAAHMHNAHHSDFIEINSTETDT